MKVKELIEALLKEDQDKIVVVDGYEGGYNGLTQSSIIHKTIYYYPSDYFGEYDDASFSIDESKKI